MSDSEEVSGEEEGEVEEEEEEVKGEKKKEEEKIDLEEQKTYLNQLDCASSVASVLVLYFFNGELDSTKLKESLNKTIDYIPQLSSVIKSEEGATFHKYGGKFRYYLSHVTPSNVQFTEKEVPDETFELFKLEKDGLINYEEGDAHAFSHIMSIWSDLYNGKAKEELKKLVFDRVECFKPSKDYEKSKLSEEQARKFGMFHAPNPTNDGQAFTRKYVCRNLVFTKERIDELKKLVDTKERFSSHDVISAHIYKLFALLREYPNDTLFPSLISMNFRTRVEKISEEYFGNAIVSLVTEKTRNEVLTSSFSDTVMDVRKNVNSFNEKDLQDVLDERERKIPFPSYNWLHGSSVNDWRSFSKSLPSFGDLKPERLSFAPPPGIIAPHFYILLATGKEYTNTSTIVYIEKKIYERIKGDKIDFTASNAFDIVGKKMKENVIPDRFSKELLEDLAKKLKVPKITSVRQLGSGMNFVNANYLLEYAEGEGENRKVQKVAVFRSYEDFKFRDFPDASKHEFDVLKLVESKIKDVKIAPKVLFYDNSKKLFENEYLIEEYIEGKAGALPELSNEKILTKYAGLLKRIHSIRKPLYSSQMDVLEKDYLFHREETKEAFLKHASLLDKVMEPKMKDFSSEMKELFEKSIEVTKDYMEKFDSLERTHLIHGDAHIGNLLINEKTGDCTLLDYDVMRWNTFYEDLAELISIGMLTPKFEEVVLDAYFGKDKKATQLDRKVLWIYKIKMLCYAVSTFIYIVKAILEKGGKVPLMHQMVITIYSGHLKKVMDEVK